MIRVFADDGTEDCHGHGSIPENQSTLFTINQNIPNLFNDITTINYELYSAAEVTIEIIDITGKSMRTIQQGNQTPGAHSTEIDGSSLASGIYFYTFTVGEEQITKRMLVRH